MIVHDNIVVAQTQTYTQIKWNRFLHVNFGLRAHGAVHNILFIQIFVFCRFALQRRIVNGDCFHHMRGRFHF